MSSRSKPAAMGTTDSYSQNNQQNLSANHGAQVSSVPFPGPSNSSQKIPQIDLHPPFPWDTLKAESLRAVCRDIVGMSIGGPHVKVGGKRGEMIAFLRTVEELGRDKALEMNFHDIEEPSATGGNRKRKRTLGEDNTAEGKTAESGDDESGEKGTKSPRRTMRTRKSSTRDGNTNGAVTPAQERTSRRKSRAEAKDDKKEKLEGKRRKGKAAEKPHKRGGGVFDGVLLTPRKDSGKGGIHEEDISAEEKDMDMEQRQEQEEEEEVKGSDVHPGDAGSDVAAKELRREPVVIMVERTVETVVDTMIPGPPSPQIASTSKGVSSHSLEQFLENGGLSKDSGSLAVNTSLQDEEEEDVEMDLGSPSSASPEATTITLGTKVVQDEGDPQEPGAGPPQAKSSTVVQATGGSSLIAQYESSEGSQSSERDDLNLTVYA